MTSGSGSVSISVVVSSVSVERSLSALKAVVEGDMKLEDDDGAPGTLEGGVVGEEDMTKKIIKIVYVCITSSCNELYM